MSYIKYYSISDAIECDIETDHKPFIIAHERITTKGDIGREYIVFDSFMTFIDNRTDFPHAHELLADHYEYKSDLSGRLVFDFDIKNKKIPNNFCEIVERNIKKVIMNYMHGNIIEESDELEYNPLFSNINDLEFVWSSCKNNNKFSKHLTVRNLLFENWKKHSKLFYKFFSVVWDNDPSNSWINSEDLIDFQIIRNHASLRMVGSKKINGNSLLLDNSNYDIQDSLIRIYRKKQRRGVIIVSDDNFSNDAIQELEESFDTNNTKTLKNNISDPDIFMKAFEIINELKPNIFSRGKISGSVMSLLRKHASDCLLSGKIHDSENAYIVIKELGDRYAINFGCYRNCHIKKTMKIGEIEK